MRALGTLALLATACGGAPPSTAPSATEDARVYVNARVLTMDPARPRAAALRIEGQRITHVLEHDDPALTGRRVDLGGSTVLPGLVDAHLHLVGLGRMQRRLDLVGTRSAAEVIERVREAATQTPPGQWIRGRGWDQNDWADPTWPTHEALSRAAPDHPVWLQRVDGHAVWVNARAMALAGVDADTPDPEGGEILRLSEGAPSGVFVDNAVDRIRAHLPAPTPAEIRGDLERAFAMCRQAGLTGVHDMGVDPEVLEVLRAMERDGSLTLRVTAYLSGERDETYSIIESPADRDGLLTVVGVKLYADGALGSRGAALFEPYDDRPDHRGLLVYAPEELARRVARVHAAGYQVAIHAIGDRGIATALDAIEAAQGEDRGRRHRLEHAQVIRPADVERLVSAGVVASMQPTHATSDMPWAEARVGAERIRGAYAWRTMLERGATLAFGSDAPVESHRPAWGLYAAITRQDAEGQPEGGWTPSQRLRMEEALAAFTRGPAEAIGREDLGVIRPGAAADLTIVRGDVLAMDALEVRALEVRETVVAGAD